MKLSEAVKTGDLIAVSGTGWVSRVIGKVTFGKFSHFALVCEGQIYETDGAWRMSKWSEITKYDDSKVRVFRIKSFTDEYRRNLVRVCTERLGHKYSYWDCAVQACLSFLNPRISERIGNRVQNPLRTKCDEEVQICHNLARGEAYFRFPGGKNPQVLMDELMGSLDAELVLDTL